SADQTLDGSGSRYGDHTCRSKSTCQSTNNAKKKAEMRSAFSARPGKSRSASQLDRRVSVVGMPAGAIPLDGIAVLRCFLTGVDVVFKLRSHARAQVHHDVRVGVARAHQLDRDLAL